MARPRRNRRRPYVDLRAGGALPPLLNFNAPGGPRQTTVARGRPVRETVAGGEFALPQARGLRIRRGVRTNYGVRDLVVDQQGNTLAAITGWQGAQLRMSTTGPDGGRRLVVGRGSATTGGGAAPTTSGAGGDIVWSGRVNPNRTTLDRDFGAGQYDVAQENGRFVVRRKPPPAPTGPPDPYAAYDAYPSIKNYLSGLDRQYDSFQNYLTNTYNPQITAASQSLTQARLASGNAYNNAIQNYSNSAGNVAAAITTPQVAGMMGGTVVAPNQNALGAAQSMAAAANVGRNVDAGYRTALGGLEAEKMGQSFLSSSIGYGAGLLNQYGQKRQTERLRLDQWIEEQKAAAAEAASKRDIDLMKMDQSMINSLIISGDRAAAREVTTRVRTLRPTTSTPTVALSATGGSGSRRAQVHAASTSLPRPRASSTTSRAVRVAVEGRVVAAQPRQSVPLAFPRASSPAGQASLRRSTRAGLRSREQDRQPLSARPASRRSGAP